MSAGVVHYTDRYTVYGPLRPGPDGMAYATLRVRHDPGASFMPEARHRLAELLATSARSAQDRRNVTIDLRTSPDEAGGDATSEWLDLLTGADGLRVAVHQGIGGSSMAPVLVGGAGAYIAVVDGALDDAGTPRGPGAIAWQDPGTSFHAVATDSGARVALLQFPVV